MRMARHCTSHHCILNVTVCFVYRCSAAASGVFTLHCLWKTYCNSWYIENKWLSRWTGCVQWEGEIQSQNLSLIKLDGVPFPSRLLKTDPSALPVLGWWISYSPCLPAVKTAKQRSIGFIKAPLFHTHWALKAVCVSAQRLAFIKQAGIKLPVYHNCTKYTPDFQLCRASRESV